MNLVSYEEFLAIVKSAESFVICSHQSPDGDGIGSCIALSNWLRSIGKKTYLYSKDGVPKNLQFLPGSFDFIASLPKDEKFDVAIMADCAQRKRISDEFAEFKGAGKYVCVDHHLLITADADALLIDENAASTGEVVLRLIERAQAKVTQEIAQCIYTTLAVDTGFFKYSNTSAEVFAAAAKLVGFGASPWEVSKNIEESHPASRMRLLALSLASFEVGFDGRYATMDVTADMLKKSGATIDLSDEFASYPRSVEGVEVSALFRELEDKRVKVSMRSKDVVDVAELSRIFGGGGHARAAGFRMHCTIAEAKKKVAEALKAVIPEKAGIHSN